MNSKQLDLVIDLSRTLSFRKTAENMYITQPALTHQVKTLEAELGVQLFQRNSQGVSMTPAGELFCRSMAQITARSQEILTSVRNCSANGYSETLHVGMNVARTFEQNRDIVRQFTREYPEILLDIRQDTTGVGRLDAFLRNELDIVFFLNDNIPGIPSIRTQKLFDSGIYCVVQADHPLAARQSVGPKDLEGEYMVLFQGNGLTSISHAQEQLVKNHPVRSRLCGETETALLMVSSLNGAALMPGFCYRNNSDFAWIRYEDPSTIPSGLAWHSDDNRPFVKRFVEIAEEVFEKARRDGCIL